MKVFVKTLKGSHFQIEVKSEDTVADVKKNIETSQGQNVYPAGQQMLIYKGKILKDDTTLEQNAVAENSFLVIMLSKTKPSAGGAPGASVVSSASQAKPSAGGAPGASVASSASQTSTSTTAPPSTPAPVPPQVPTETPAPASAPAPAPVPAVTPAPTSAVTTVPAPVSTASTETDAYGQAASNLVAGSNLEQAIQHILDMGGGTWDRDTVVRALRAAYNNPERAVDYLYSGIPEQAEAPPVVRAPPAAPAVNPSVQAPPTQPAVPSSGPNANPLDLFPQGLPNVGSIAGSNTLDFLRNSPQFQAFRAMVQANPQILQPLLQELGKQNPQLVRMIQEHQADFLQLINEPIEGEGNLLGQLAQATQQTVTVTPEEREAIERLESMGFDRALVLEVFFACNKNEQLAANYLLDHMHESED